MNRYMMMATHEWVGKYVWYESNRFKVLDIVQTGGFEKPSTDLTFDLVLEGGTQVGVADVTTASEPVSLAHEAIAERWHQLLKYGGDDEELERVERQVWRLLKVKRLSRKLATLTEG